MTLWEFRCVSNGFRKFNGGEASKEKPPSEDRFEEIVAQYGE